MKKIVICFFSLIGLLICACNDKLGPSATLTDSLSKEDSLAFVKMEDAIVDKLSEKDDGVSFDLIYDDFMAMLQSSPNSFYYQFPKLRQYYFFKIIEPNDNRWRIYKGCSNVGSLFEYSNIIQYKADDGSIHVLESKLPENELHGSELEYKADIVKQGDNDIYLTYFHDDGIQSEVDEESIGVTAFRIDGDKIVFPPVFDDGFEKSCTYSVPAYFTCFLEKQITYDEEKGTLTLPLIVRDKSERDVPNGRQGVFRFDGNSFVKVEEKAPDYLNKDLRMFNSCLQETIFEKFMVRVDSLDNGQLRYASWKTSDEMINKPDLVIVGGKHDYENNVYIFENDGYEYMINDSKENIRPNGLVVKKDGKIILEDVII